MERVMRVKQRSQSSLLREYTKAYLDGRGPAEYTEESQVTYTGRYRGRLYEIPLPKHDMLQAAVAAAAKK